MKYFKLSLIIVVLGLLCSCSKKPVCEYYPQETVFTDPEGEYTLVVDEKFYEDFPNVALVYENDVISVRFETCTEPEELVIDQQYCTLTQDNESSPYFCKIFKFAINKFENYKKHYERYIYGPWDGILRSGIVQSDDYILTWSPIDIPMSHYFENPNGYAVITEYQEALDSFWNYIRNSGHGQAAQEYMKGVEGPEFDVSVKEKNLLMSEYFSFIE